MSTLASLTKPDLKPNCDTNSNNLSPLVFSTPKQEPKTKDFSLAMKQDKKTRDDSSLSQKVYDHINNSDKKIKLYEIHSNLRSLYEKDICYLIDHVIEAIKKNRATVLSELIACAPWTSPDLIKELDKHFYEAMDKQFTILQYAQGNNSTECRFVLMHYGANATNIFKDPSLVHLEKHSALK